MSYKYSKKTVTPIKKVEKERKTIEEKNKECLEYNETHGTLLSYGVYWSMKRNGLL